MTSTSGQKRKQREILLNVSRAIRGELGDLPILGSRSSNVLGMALQINTEDVTVLRGLGYEILDHELGIPARDWVGAFDTWYQQRLQGGVAARDAAAKDNLKTSRPSLALNGYAGSYSDAWYGPVAVTTRGDKLRLDFRQTPNMAGTLTHWQYDTFRVNWDDASIEPAYVIFALDAEGKVAQITMKAVSPVADFSYDYQDLLFKPAATQ